MDAVDWGGAETAFDLADQYHEYGFLVQLCTHPNFGGAAKTIHYLRKYREAFAFHLYKWYLENGMFYERLRLRCSLFITRALHCIVGAAAGIPATRWSFFHHKPLPSARVDS